MSLYILFLLCKWPQRALSFNRDNDVKNSYGTGQKTNEEFAVMLTDNLYTNSNEGLAAYGRLANKDILCIYSEDGLSIRCLDEENSEVDLPTVMFL